MNEWNYTTQIYMILHHILLLLLRGFGFTFGLKTVTMISSSRSILIAYKELVWFHGIIQDVFIMDMLISGTSKLSWCQVSLGYLPKKD